MTELNAEHTQPKKYYPTVCGLQREADLFYLFIQDASEAWLSPLVFGCLKEKYIQVIHLYGGYGVHLYRATDVATTNAVNKLSLLTTFI